MDYFEYTFEEAKAISTKDRKDLKACEVEVDDVYKTGKSRRLSPKNCFSKAFEYMSEKKGVEQLRLVHGDYKPKSIEHHCNHAWVELPNNVIFDGVLQRFYDKEKYYSHYEIKNTSKYTYDAMYEVGRRAGGHYGPWERVSQI